ncbi:TfoX/Sxy family protein [Marinibacterium sp. SX1]|uniref:TfoX/Sxy family protein n=1 Tax=Marinibacterium sp. SX1 TaxID=3388424 RepID=UPI003D165591
MAYDEARADLMRADFGVEPGLGEKRMFGGICFLLHGNMLGGYGPKGALYRPGKTAEPDFLAIDGVAPMMQGRRRMSGFVRLDDGAFDDATLRQRLTDASLAHVAGLPPKE